MTRSHPPRRAVFTADPITRSWLVESSRGWPSEEAAQEAVWLLDTDVASVRIPDFAGCFSPVERAVLAYTDCLVLEGGRVPDGVFAALKAELSDVEILELTYITCTYAMHATMSRALRLEYDDADDPVQEVPAPESASNDVMSMVDRAAE